jgi:hypothetical protein
MWRWQEDSKGSWRFEDGTEGWKKLQWVCEVDQKAERRLPIKGEGSPLKVRFLVKSCSEACNYGHHCHWAEEAEAVTCKDPKAGLGISTQQSHSMAGPSTWD